MALTVVWEKASIVRGDGTETVMKRGDTLPDDVPEFQRSVYTMIGAVKDVEQVAAYVQQATEAEAATFTPAVAPTYPPESVAATEPAADDTQAAEEPPPALTKPAAADTKDAWEDYAVACGYLTRAEAESLTKAKLVAEVNKHETA